MAEVASSRLDYRRREVRSEAAEPVRREALDRSEASVHHRGQEGRQAVQNSEQSHRIHALFTPPAPK